MKRRIGLKHKDSFGFFFFFLLGKIMISLRGEGNILGPLASGLFMVLHDG